VSVAGHVRRPVMCSGDET